MDGSDETPESVPRIQYRADPVDTFNQLSISLYHTIQDHFRERYLIIGDKLTVYQFRVFLESLRPNIDSMVDYAEIAE